MTQEITTITLTPAQFPAARALAQTYFHLWSSVPDGTYDMKDIREYGKSIDNEISGITMPHYYMDTWGNPVINHTTGTGRLKWEVNSSGNVLIEVYRPNDQIRAYETLEDKYKGSDATYPKATLVARVQVINDNFNVFDPDEMEVIWHTDNHELLNDEKSEFSIIYDEEVKSQELAERNVACLIRPLVALLTINKPRDTHSHEEYDLYRAEVLQPAIDRVKEWFAPFFALADPDPITTEYVRSESRTKWDGSAGDPLPETYWHKRSLQPQYFPIFVCHKGEEFPVESEKTALAVMRLLKERPEASLMDAVIRVLKTGDGCILAW